MTHPAGRRAMLLAELPAARYRILPGGRAPFAGDLVVPDQAFTGPDGAHMVLVYGEASGRDLYEADVYVTELRSVPALA